jgi:alpha-glucosidase
VTPNYVTANVQIESVDPDSLLNWHRRLIALRRATAALRDGKTVMLDETNASVLTYLRVSADGHAILVSLNMSPESQTVSLKWRTAGVQGSRLKTLLSSPRGIKSTAANQLTLPPFAAWVAEVR